MDLAKVLVHDRLEIIIIIIIIIIKLFFSTNSLSGTALDPKIHLYMSITIFRDV